MPSIFPGQTFLAKTGSPSDASREHLYVVLTEPNDKGCIIWVSWNSLKDGRFYDKTCVLDVGDHPFITKKTWVNYGRAAIVTVEEIKRNLARGVLAENDPMKEEVFNRIAAGLLASDHTPMEAAEFYRFYQALP
jgi:hypothetical protein